MGGFTGFSKMFVLVAGLAVTISGWAKAEEKGSDVCGSLDNGLPGRGKEYWIHDTW